MIKLLKVFFICLITIYLPSCAEKEIKMTDLSSKIEWTHEGPLSVSEYKNILQACIDNGGQKEVCAKQIKITFPD
jgi:hypothetical protein